MTITEIEHIQLVENLKKPGVAILATITADKADAIHMALGVASECGELIDAIKKWTIYNKPLDRENVIEELGDIEWFLQGIRETLNITRDEVLRANIDKLNKRYHLNKYSDQQAQDRADKV